MNTRDRIYKQFNVTTDDDAYDAIMDHIDGEAEGKLISQILPDNTLTLSFTPFFWSDYTACDTVGTDRYDAMFNLMALLLDQSETAAEIETAGVLVGEVAEEIPCETCGALFWSLDSDHTECRKCDEMAGEDREQWEADMRLNLALIGLAPKPTRSTDDIYARAYADDY